MPDPTLVNRVATWILEGNTLDDVREAIASPVDAGGLGRSDVDELLAAGLAAIGARSMPDNPRLSFHLEARRELYRRSMALADYKTCLSVLQDVAKLEKLYDKAPTSRSTAHGWTETATDDEYPIL